MFALGLLKVVSGSALADPERTHKAVPGFAGGLLFGRLGLFGTVVYIKIYHIVIHNYFNKIHTYGFFFN